VVPLPAGRGAAAAGDQLERTIADYVRGNSYYTPGGMFTEPHLRFCLDVLGPERLLPGLAER